MSWLAKNSGLTRYDDQDFFYIRKPHDVPSVRGFQLSFFEVLDDYIVTHDDELTGLLLSNQQHFGIDSEWGLCNRLDTPTAGLLYFAKSRLIHDSYRSLQKTWSLIKHYLATATGRIDTDRLIARDMAHHPHLDDRMITAHCGQTAHRGRRQQGWTQLEPLSYDADHNHTHVAITIAGGVRHQIRIHCASMGSPLVGETLYGTSKNRQPDTYLHLWCIWHQKIKVSNSVI